MGDVPPSNRQVSSAHEFRKLAQTRARKPSSSSLTGAGFSAPAPGLAQDEVAILRCASPSLINRATREISWEDQAQRRREGYRAGQAGAATWDRSRRPKRCKLRENRASARIVAAKLRMFWSPEQIAGWLQQTCSRDEPCGHGVISSPRRGPPNARAYDMHSVTRSSRSRNQCGSAESHWGVPRMPTASDPSTCREQFLEAFALSLEPAAGHRLRTRLRGRRAGGQCVLPRVGSVSCSRRRLAGRPCDEQGAPHPRRGRSLRELERPRQARPALIRRHEKAARRRLAASGRPPGGGVLGRDQARFLRRRANKAIAPRPDSIRARFSGSGTAATSGVTPRSSPP